MPSLFQARALQTALRLLFCLALPLSLPLLWTGCATSPIELHERGGGQSDQSPWSGTAILLNYAYDSTDALTLSQGCTLILRNVNSGQDYSIRLPGTRHVALIGIPGGTYSGRSMSCPHYARWELQSFLKGGFTPVQDRINFLGKVIFRFGVKNQSLVTVDSGQTVVTEGLARDIASWPDSWKNALEDPFTRRPISPDMMERKPSYLLDIHTTGFLHQGERPASTADLENSLRACDLAEQESYPYRLGTLRYTAEYADRKLLNLTKTDHNSFSATFLSCLDRSLRGFQPDTASKLQVIVTI